METSLKPRILVEGSYSKLDLEIFKQSCRIWKFNDLYERQLSELFEINHPDWRLLPDFSQKKNQFIKDRLNKSQGCMGNWIYYPWSGQLIHLVSEPEYEKIRTNRNKDLINQQEQQQISEFCVGMTGLSVGNSVVLGLSYQGMTKNMKLADFDNLETSNLNRVRAGIQHIGLSKIELTARQIYEINPYANLILFPQGLTTKKLDIFFSSTPRLQVVFDEIDDIKMKIELRLKARSAGIPVLMLTNLGDGFMVDIERFDLDQSLSLFNGKIDEAVNRIQHNKSISSLEKNKFVVEIVGTENIPSRALESVKAINRTLVGRPQLSSTVSISSGVAVYLVRRLALKQPLPSGRILIKLDEILGLFD